MIHIDIIANNLDCFSSSAEKISYPQRWPSIDVHYF